MNLEERLVYFAKPAGLEGPIKIGSSVEPEQRLKFLSWGLGQKIELIAAVAGGHWDEAHILNMFAGSRVLPPKVSQKANGASEWRAPTSGLMEFIGSVQERGALPFWGSDLKQFRVWLKQSEGKTKEEIASKEGVAPAWIPQIVNAIDEGRAKSTMLAPQYGYAGIRELGWAKLRAIAKDRLSESIAKTEAEQ